ncbi:MAG: hypothetical protein K2X37_02395 [Chitinophagaceae bacterium]|jgi:hypothetical protein|nr:hypothetical protein [Chitinophagaceae bacterium]
MKKKTIRILLYCILPIASQLHAQQSLSDSIALDRYIKNKTNLTILASWAGVNMVQGMVSATNAKGADKYFFEGNAYWNLINAGVATYGLVQLRKEVGKKYTLAENLISQHKLEKLLLLNTGLDLAYITTGLYLRERGDRLTNDKTNGYGGTLILQGAFLLVFDIVQYGNHRRNGKILEKEANQLQIMPTSTGVGLVYRFK